jgi:hypothetical protein
MVKKAVQRLEVPQGKPGPVGEQQGAEGSWQTDTVEKLPTAVTVRMEGIV